jgi:flagellar motor protein MotB
MRFIRRKADLESLWLLTFADLMMQLMAVFALLYSFSAADQTKLEQAVKSIQKALGVEQKLGPPAGDGILPGSTGLDPAKASDLEKLLSAAQATEAPDVGTRLRFVNFRGGVIFEEGTPTLTPGSDVLLVRLSVLANRYQGFTLVCEGHAAPGERGRNGADALELSSQRALAAQRYLAALGVPAARLTSEARGDSQPEGDGGTPEGRALQRFVSFRFQRVADR